ncbi:hypothetical protein H0H81_003794 [Sphagnurus paluster]|uniref:Peroxisomal biogenesis factor 11 n=1 Tax=Sphagnurus paluster TaxID=117069 RepID=A0A9P7GRD3_9AGAR|nr:hypothetical protein H0H81_003794 [Sphagnurus paluster]
MATAASQVILHPLVSQGLKYGSTTLGRDKLYRTVQYFARFFAWYLLNKGDKIDAARWSALKSHLGTARKCKPIEHLQAALRATLTTGPALEQILTIGRQLAYFGYLSYDTLIWANAIKFISLNPETAKRVGKTSNRLWFAGIVFNLVNGVLKTVRLKHEAKRLRAGKSRGEKDVGEETQRETRLSAIKSAQAATRRQFTIDILDVWLPATGSGIVNLSEGTLGIFGLITSILGMQAQWKAVNGK